MGCAAASLTPPNVSAASLEGDAPRTVGPVNSSASNSAALASRLDKDIKVTCLLSCTQDCGSVTVCVCVTTIGFYVCGAKQQQIRTINSTSC